jgi:hypothetical protein
MDVQQTLQTLYTERARLIQVIANLEDLRQHRNGGRDLPHPKRRGRKFMGAEERKAVSERMKRYWAMRHAGAQAGIG